MSGDAMLEFSTDTLRFDTVFTELGSATRSFRVRNNNDLAVRISNVRLENPNSRYNYTLKNGDVIRIPKKQDFVTIVGATQADRVQGPSVGKGNAMAEWRYRIFLLRALGY